MIHRLVVACGGDHEPGTAHAMVLREAAALTGTALGGWRLAHHCGECGSNEHGRPLALHDGGSPDTSPIHVSVARAGGLVVVAVTSAGPVGVDLETAGALDAETYDDVAGHAAENPRSDATVSWVRKESILKSAGRGLAIDPRTLRVSAAAAAPALLSWPIGKPDPGPLVMVDLDVADGFVAAVTVRALSLPPLDVRRAAAAARGG